MSPQTRGLSRLFDLGPSEARVAFQTLAPFNHRCHVDDQVSILRQKFQSFAMALSERYVMRSSGVDDTYASFNRHRMIKSVENRSIPHDPVEYDPLSTLPAP
jgi:hypothetical protein